MIESILISNYALIEQSELIMERGFSVITGETGAGKSILLGALGLALGARSDSSVVRDKSGKCIVEVCFNLDGYSLEHWFSDNDLDYNVHSVVRREVWAEGKSRSFINDTPVSVKQLKEFGGFLIDIHSQHQSLLLGQPDFQIDMLDAFCGNDALLLQYKAKYRERLSLVTELERAKTTAANAESERDYLSFRYSQLDVANLRAGEVGELEAEQRLLESAEQIKSTFAECTYSLRDADDNIVMRLKELANNMGKLDDVLSEAREFSERVKSAAIDLADLADDAERKGEGVDIDSKRLQSVTERLGVIYDLQLKFKVSSEDELLAERDSLLDKLRNIDSDTSLVSNLEGKLKELESGLDKLATQLHERRVAAVPSLRKRMEELLVELGIKHPVFQVELSLLSSFAPLGKDSVRLLFAANKNQQPGDISNVASGGEISRVMLAFKYILSRSKKLPVVIFDEIDTGLSGEVAHKMAEMMREMSKEMQVIAISHLPQIASAGDAHFKVYKVDSDVETISKIKRLSRDERIAELAAMMSGSSVTDEALRAAEKLLH